MTLELGLLSAPKIGGNARAEEHVKRRRRNSAARWTSTLPDRPNVISPSTREARRQQVLIRNTAQAGQISTRLVTLLLALQPVPSSSNTPGRLSNPRHHAVARSHGPLCAHRNLSGQHDRRVYDRYLGMFSHIPNIPSWSRDRPAPGLGYSSRNGFS